MNYFLTQTCYLKVFVVGKLRALTNHEDLYRKKLYNKVDKKSYTSI